MEYRIRNEEPKDYAAVEDLTRREFYNIYVPGCSEHFLVREMRGHPDFVPELDLIMEHEGAIIGSILYTRARLVNESSHDVPILTFGPICIKKEFQRRGLGKALMDHSFRRAVSLGFGVVVIFGNPGNYVSSGFRSCQRYSISLKGGVYPTAMLVKELVPGSVPEGQWEYVQSTVYEFDPQKAEEYDTTLPPLEKRQLPQQEEFYILSHSSLGRG